MGDSLSFSEVLSETEPEDAAYSERRIQVRKREVEVRSRRSMGRGARTQHQFFVIDTDEEEVIWSGDTTTDSHHNPFGEAQARAFGIAFGYNTALTADEPEYHCEACGVGLSHEEYCAVGPSTPLARVLGLDSEPEDHHVVCDDCYTEGCEMIADGE